ncbi:hypothetical protein HDV00_005371 [Rhizophlyctis rosea]|nr:hypothetical protein HDV00_005371 [Rhizophlyctis rosea]
MHLILTGATGLVGTSVLAHVISTAQTPAATTTARRVTHLSILTRNPQISYLQRHPLSDSASSNLKIDVIEHKDFTTYSPELLKRLKGADGVVWALGVSQNDVKDEEEYVQVTKVYAEKAAEAFSGIEDVGQRNGTKKLNFVYISGEGATHSPSFLTPLFGRVKGLAEKSLLSLPATHPTLTVYAARPGGVDPLDQPDVAETILPKFLNNSLKKLYYTPLLKVFRTVYPGLLSPTRELGKVLTDLAVGDGSAVQGKGTEAGGFVVTNAALRRLGGL